MKLKFFLLFLSAALLSTVQLYSQLVGSDVRVTNGYRVDKFSSSVAKFNDLGDVLEQNNFAIKDMNIYQIGAKANFYAMGAAIRAEFNYGWIHNGWYRESAEGFNTCPIASRGNVRKGKVRDISIGGTYFFIDTPDFYSGHLYLGASGGYSRSQQNVSLGNVITNDRPDDVLSGLGYNNRWQGPWAGVDAVFDIATVKVRAAYEYHWANWRGRWTLLGEDVREAFSDKRSSHHAHGNVAFVEAFCNLGEFLVLGVGLKWQRWSQRKGTQEPVNEEMADFFAQSNQKYKVRHACWDSVAGTIDIGYRF